MKNFFLCFVVILACRTVVFANSFCDDTSTVQSTIAIAKVNVIKNRCVEHKEILANRDVAELLYNMFNHNESVLEFQKRCNELCKDVATQNQCKTRFTSYVNHTQELEMSKYDKDEMCKEVLQGVIDIAESLLFVQMSQKVQK